MANQKASKKKKKVKSYESKMNPYKHNKRGRGSSAQARGRSKSPRKSSKKSKSNSLEKAISPTDFYNLISSSLRQSSKVGNSQNSSWVKPNGGSFINMMATSQNQPNHLKTSNIQIYKAINPTPKKSKSKLQTYSLFNNSVRNSARRKKSKKQKT